MADVGDPFRDFLAELGDGQKWALIRAEGWEDFVNRLTEKVADLPVQRRRALLMMLLAMAAGQLTPERVEQYMTGRDMEDDAEVDALIGWLRQFKPRADD